MKTPPKSFPGVWHISLQPYPGELFVTKNRAAFSSVHKQLFGNDCELGPMQNGCASTGTDRWDRYTHLVYAHDAPVLAHELAHVIFALFSSLRINPCDSNEEPFCYMLSHCLEKALPLLNYPRK